MRERLVELLKSKVKFRSIHISLAEKFSDVAIETIADHLIANGVILPPCKVGDEIYHLQRIFDDATLLIRVVIKKRKVDFASTTNSRFAIEADGFIFNECDFGKTVFFTREEAEKALKERSEQ